jgi:hypothetical protein
MNQLAPMSNCHAPALTAAPGVRASNSFLERILHGADQEPARRRAATEFFDWLKRRALRSLRRSGA